MNIKEAKEQIKNTVRAYLTKDEFGDYVLPIEKQRPVFLMGPPGIGKTAIMEQIAGELGIGILSYSMTHHTRQSALGLPFISHKVYGGEEVDISEYTMSEIIASVYDMMEATGVENGILFLDEINCVSETLSPIMLQFLQYKVFGKHQVPGGWVVVTAGNPPEFNNSVREFDVVTWDRLKRIDVEADFEIWKEYATEKGVHPAILTYLEAKNSNFYSIKQTVDGKRFATARGWEDLSQIMRLYEKNDTEIDYSLVIQYLQDEDIARDFAIYFDLFKKYKSEYNILDILTGKSKKAVIKKAKESSFEERLAIIGMFLDHIREESERVLSQRDILKGYKTKIDLVGERIEKEGKVAEAMTVIKEIDTLIREAKESGKLSEAEILKQKRIRNYLETVFTSSKKEAKKEELMKAFSKDYMGLVDVIKEDVKLLKEKYDRMFAFLEETFGADKEVLMVVTELTKMKSTIMFISTFGCAAYFKYSKEFMFNERKNDIDKALKDMGLLDE